MELLKQNAPCFPELVQRYACRAFDLMGIAQLQAGQALTAEQISVLIEQAQKEPGEWDENKAWTGVLGPQMQAGKNEHLLIEWAFEALGHPEMRGRQVGQMKGSSVIYWGGTQPWQYRIGHWRTGGSDGHWTLWDAAGAEVFDPWDGNPPHAPVNKIELDRCYLYRVWMIG